MRIQSLFLIPASLFLAFLLISCSDPNPEAPGENGIHPTSWTTAHAAEADITACMTCHGSDYQGSGAATSCYACHFDGPPFGLHPSNWTDVYVDHRAFVSANGFTTCATAACHGTSPFVQGGLAAPSCGSADFTNENGVTHSCHSGHVVTGASWLLPSGHVATAIADPSSCFSGICHDMTVSGANPACRDCHTAAAPFYDAAVCTSCHDNPPSSGEHNRHVNGEGYGCMVCHYGYGSNSLGHWYPDPNPPANVVFEPGVGTITYNGSTCSGSCHGEGHNDSW